MRSAEKDAADVTMNVKPRLQNDGEWHALRYSGTPKGVRKRQEQSPLAAGSTEENLGLHAKHDMTAP